MKMRLIPSKIRKREDSSVVSAVNVESPVPHRHHHHHSHQNQQYHQNLQQAHQNNGANKVAAGDAVQQQNNSPWVFPPLPPQPNIYSVNQVSTLSLPGQGRQSVTA